MRATETQRINGEPASSRRKHTEGGFGHTMVPGGSSRLLRVRQLMREVLRSNEGLGPTCSVNSEFVEVYKQLQLKWEVLQVSERKKSNKKSSQIFFSGSWNAWKDGHLGEEEGKP